MKKVVLFKTQWLNLLDVILFVSFTVLSVLISLIYYWSLKNFLFTLRSLKSFTQISSVVPFTEFPSFWITEFYKIKRKKLITLQGYVHTHAYIYILRIRKCWECFVSFLTFQEYSNDSLSLVLAILHFDVFILWIVSCLIQSIGYESLKERTLI